MKEDGRIILVTGATGQQGGAVAQELLNAGHRVRAMTRKPEADKAKALAAAGAEVVQGDLDDAVSLQRVLEGVWGVFGVQNTWEAGVEKEEEQGKRLAELAKKAGVRHFVYTSVGSAHRDTGIPHFDNKWRVEETVRSLAFPSWVILRPVFFMENFMSPWYKPAIDEGRLVMAVRPETVLQTIAVADIGKYGALAFEKHEELSGSEIDIAGDELTLPQTAEVMAAAAGHPVEFVSQPIEEVRAWSEDFALMLEWFDAQGYEADIAGNASRYGIRPTRFREWVASLTEWTATVT